MSFYHIKLSIWVAICPGGSYCSHMWMCMCVFMFTMYFSSIHSIATLSQFFFCFIFKIFHVQFTNVQWYWMRNKTHFETHEIRNEQQNAYTIFFSYTHSISLFRSVSVAGKKVFSVIRGATVNFKKHENLSRYTKKKDRNQSQSKVSSNTIYEIDNLKCAMQMNHIQRMAWR